MLGLLGLDFEVVAAGVDELTEGDPPVIVVENALRKARAVASPRRARARRRHRRRLRRAAARQARRRRRGPACLRALSGRTHEVLSGIALIAGGEERSELVRTAVAFRELDDREIEPYVASGEWRDRAGGYAVQGLGSTLVERIEGDVSNVVGLPIPALSRMIAELQDALGKCVPCVGFCSHTALQRASFARLAPLPPPPIAGRGPKPFPAGGQARKPPGAASRASSTPPAPSTPFTTRAIETSSNHIWASSAT